MADRDWDKELAKIDKQLGSLRDEDLLAPAPVPAKAGAAPAAGKAKAAPAAAPERATKAWAVYARLTISVLLGIGMLIWPYPSRCGAGLAGYLAAVVVVITSGVWSAVWAWRHSASPAHRRSLF